MSTMRETITVEYGSAIYHNILDSMHAGRPVEWNGGWYTVARCATDLAKKEATFLLFASESGSSEQATEAPSQPSGQGG